MTCHYILAIHLCTNHVISNVCVHMVRKVQDRSTLHSVSHSEGSVTLSHEQISILEMTAQNESLRGLCHTVSWTDMHPSDDC